MYQVRVEGDPSCQLCLRSLLMEMADGKIPEFNLRILKSDFKGWNSYYRLPKAVEPRSWEIINCSLAQDETNC
jgi:hypothetical protein